MGHRIDLDTDDGHRIAGYLAGPIGTPRGGIVVVQEIFGVTAHIRTVADGYAADGYTALAPAFFDYVERDVELAYDRAGIQRGKALALKVGMDPAVAAVAAAAQALQSAGRIGVVGYCWGGTVALLAAQRLGLPAASYYGARNVNHFDQALKAPMIFHFGAADRSIPAGVVDEHRRAWPGAPVYVYEHCGHAFNRDVDSNVYNADAARLARQRTLTFFGRELAGTP